MAGIKTLLDVYEQKGDVFLKSILDKYVIINEQANGSFFAANYSGGGWKFYKKDGEITIIDNILTRYYQKAIAHIVNLPFESLSMIPENYVFCMDYTNPSNYAEEHQVAPKHYLTLTHIQDKKTGDIINEKAILDNWCASINVAKPKIIYEGVLSDEQKMKILDFVYSPQDTLIEKFKVNSFSQYIISILNPSYQTNESIDGVVFRFDPDNNESQFVAKQIDPAFYDMSKANKPPVAQPNDYVYLSVMDLMNFIETYSLRELIGSVDSTKSFEENYIILMNKIYVDFINKYYGKYLDVNITLPSFLRKPEFDINLDLIHDDKVRELIGLGDVFKEIYKILINFFRKKKKRAYGIFNTNMVLQFNTLVDKIRNVVIGKNVYESYMPDYYEFSGAISEDFDYLGMISTKERFKDFSNRKRVNIIIDGFQPITMDHIKAAQLLHNKNKLPVVLLVQSDKSQNVLFKRETIERLLSKVRTEYKNVILDIIYINDDTIEDILRSLRPSYTPVLWGAVKNRVDDYVLQLDYAKKKNFKYNIDPKFKLVELPMLSNSARVLDYLKTDSLQSFKQFMPGSLHTEFFNLSRELGNK